MTSREFLQNELGSDLPAVLGGKICNLLDKYLKMKQVKIVKVIKAPAAHWYEKKIGKSYKVAGYSELHNAYLVDVKGSINRYIYENDCEVTTFNDPKYAEEFMTLEMEKEAHKQTVGEFLDENPDVAKEIVKDFLEQYPLTEDEVFRADAHYDNKNGSLYLFAANHNLNAWEFDIIKRVVRCRKKGRFEEDLEKTQRVIELYLKEFKS